MKFEHLVEINDLTNPMVMVIRRDQLWRGLVLRAESPKLFITYLDKAEIAASSDLSLSRVLTYGELKVKDTVSFQELVHVQYDVPAQEEIPQSLMRMTIEEPEPNSLFVRFTYIDHHTAAEDEANEMYDEYRRSAYHEADVETIRIIRELAETGRLDALPS